MQRTYVRGVLFIGLASFVPLVYYLAVVGGLLPYGGILLIAIRNLGNSSILWFSLIHLDIRRRPLLGWLNSSPGSSSELPAIMCGPLLRVCCCYWRVSDCCQFSGSLMDKSIGRTPMRSMRRTR